MISSLHKHPPKHKPEVNELVLVHGYLDIIFIVTDVAEYDNLCRVSQVTGNRSIIVPFWQIKEALTNL